MGVLYLERPKLYFIPSDKFKFEAAPELPLPYIFPELVSRENYLGFLIDGFFKARGWIGFHRDHWGLVSKYTGFQWKKTLGIFLENGGWDILGMEEKQRFIGVAERISQHQGKLTHLSEYQWEERFRRSIENVRDSHNYRKDIYKELNPEESLNKLRELRSKAGIPLSSK